jgi:hypothetical protein
MTKAQYESLDVKQARKWISDHYQAAQHLTTRDKHQVRSILIFTDPDNRLNKETQAHAKEQIVLLCSAHFMGCGDRIPQRRSGRDSSGRFGLPGGAANISSAKTTAIRSPSTYATISSAGTAIPIWEATAGQIIVPTTLANCQTGSQPHRRNNENRSYRL